MNQATFNVYLHKSAKPHIFQILHSIFLLILPDLKCHDLPDSPDRGDCHCHDPKEKRCVEMLKGENAVGVGLSLQLLGCLAR